jgi:hypothetical protein
MPESTTIAEPMSDNQALREILGELRVIDNSIRAPYTSIGNITGAVAPGVPLLRGADPKVVKTLVTNIGSFDIAVYESGVQVAVVKPNITWTSPLAGNGEIAVMALGGLASAASIASYQ